MGELQFIIPDLDASPVREYLQQHVQNALDTISDPGISLISDVGALELERLVAASNALEELSEVYEEWQCYRQKIHEFIIPILEKMEKFDKEPERAE